MELELDHEQFVQPPEFPEDKVDNTISLTLGEDAADAAQDTADAVQDAAQDVADAAQEAAQDAADAAQEAAQDAQDTPVVPPVYPDPPKPFNKEEAPTGAPGPEAAPKAEAGGQSGDRINLTQQAINQQKQKQQYSYNQPNTGYQYKPTGDDSVTGTLGLVLGIVGLALVVIFGCIGTCSGVAAFSFILTIIGLALSIAGLVISNKDKQRSGGTCSRANTAFIVSLVGVIIGAVLLIIGISCVGCIGCLACSAAGAIAP